VRGVAPEASGMRQPKAVGSRRLGEGRRAVEQLEGSPFFCRSSSSLEQDEQRGYCARVDQGDTIKGNVSAPHSTGSDPFLVCAYDS